MQHQNATTRTPRTGLVRRDKHQTATENKHVLTEKIPFFDVAGVWSARSLFSRFWSKDITTAVEQPTKGGHEEQTRPDLLREGIRRTAV